MSVSCVRPGVRVWVSRRLPPVLWPAIVIGPGHTPDKMRVLEPPGRVATYRAEALVVVADDQFWDHVHDYDYRCDLVNGVPLRLDRQTL